MTEREKLQRDIDTMRESLRLAFVAIGDPSIGEEQKQRERDSIAIYKADLEELEAQLAALSKDEADPS